MTQLSDLKPNLENPRTITDAKLKGLKKALLKFGDLGGFVYNRKSKQLVGGHQRAKLFPQGEVVITRKYEKPTKTGTVSEGFVKLNGERHKYREVLWDQNTERAANIAANKGGGEWNQEILRDWMQDLSKQSFDLDSTMFDKSEREPFLASKKDVSFQANTAAPGEDEIPEPPKKTVTKLGDVIQLGSHRLMCGDATSKVQVSRLLKGRKAEMLFTDPPYGVNYEGGHFHSGDVKIVRKREKLAADSDAGIYKKVMPVIAEWVDGPCYTWFASTKARCVIEAVEAVEAVGQLSAMLVWHKTNASYGAMNAQYKQRHEPMLYWKPKGSTMRWIGASTESTLWEIARDGRNEFHPTQKPVALAERAINNHEVATVLDLFGGSGSTMIACEKANRRCYMMEIEPSYCDVIVARWEKFTGKKAKRL